MGRPQTVETSSTKEVQYTNNRSIILLITVDSLRADHVGSFRYGHSTTPFLDALAGKGLKFESAFSNGGDTPESFPSLMTSSPPPFRIEERGARNKTIASFMKDNGHSTAAFHPNPYLSALYGYDKGFDTFYDGARSSLPPRFQFARDVTKQVFLNKGPVTDGWGLVRLASRWMKTQAAPAFLWVHFMDVHVPYLPNVLDLGFNNSVKNKSLMGLMFRRSLLDRETLVEKSTLEVIAQAYEACVRKVDRCIAVLVGQAQKYFDTVTAFVTSDHGEAFWEHGFFGHNSVYDEVIKVPLIIYSNRGLPSADVRRPTAHADILPTIAGLVHQHSTELWGIDIFEKRPPDLEDRAITSSSIVPPLGRKSFSVRTQNWKYIRVETISESSLVEEKVFDIRNDPREQENMISRNPSFCEDARTRISDLRSKGVVVFTERESAELQARLKSLGYA